MVNNFIPISKAVIISTDALKELKEKIDKIKELLRETMANPLADHLAEIDDLLEQIEFPEE